MVGNLGNPRRFSGAFYTLKYAWFAGFIHTRQNARPPPCFTPPAWQLDENDSHLNGVNTTFIQIVIKPPKMAVFKRSQKAGKGIDLIIV